MLIEWLDELESFCKPLFDQFQQAAKSQETDELGETSPTFFQEQVTGASIFIQDIVKRNNEE